MHFLEVILLVVLVTWIGVGGFLLWSVLGGVVLRPESVLPPPPRMPRVSIILAARDEAGALPAALESLLKLDYPDYEIILVNDDSSDRTGSIADEFARRPETAEKLHVVHNRVLPPGWHGKVHALSLAEHAATGEWILATDADLVFHPALLRLAVCLAHRTDAALLSLAPEFELDSFAEKVVMPAFSFLLALLFPLRLVNSPKSRRALGAGAFLLMRRQDLRALGGYARLRDTLIEDLRMAELFKHNGRRIHLAVTRGLFRTRMYQNWREMFEGLARSAFEGAGFSILKVLGELVIGNAMAVLPWVAASILLWRDIWRGIPLLHDPTFFLAAAAAAASALVYSPLLAFLGLSPLYTPTLPLAAIFYSAAALASAVSSLTGPGVRWKGRVYQPPSS